MKGIENENWKYNWKSNWKNNNKYLYTYKNKIKVILYEIAFFYGIIEAWRLDNMGTRHNTLSDDIFRNSKYINTLEQALEINDFKKEYKEQYDIMLDVYKMLITINNILFADSNKSINDKIYEMELEFEKMVGEQVEENEDEDIHFNQKEKRKHKYSVRTLKGLIDSNTRYLFNKFVEWYDYLMDINKLDKVKEEVAEEMARLESIDFDKVVKGGLTYEKNKNSNYKIYTSKLDYLYPNNSDVWKEYEQDFYDTYGITLNKQEKNDIYFIYKLIAYSNNGIVKLLFQDEIKDFELTVKDNAEDYFKAYLTSLNIDIKDNEKFMKKAGNFLNELFITNNVIMEQLENDTKNEHIIDISHIEIEPFVANYDLYFFYANMEKITSGMFEFTIKTDVIVKIINDLKEIYNLMYDNVPTITNENQVQEAFSKVQNIIERNKKMFERLS